MDIFSIAKPYKNIQPDKRLRMENDIRDVFTSLKNKNKLAYFYRGTLRIANNFHLVSLISTVVETYNIVSCHSLWNAFLLSCLL